VYLDYGRLVSLMETFGPTGPAFERAEPYLEALGAAVAGARAEGDGVAHARFVVMLK
jgi:hypothetical protein